MRRMRSLTVIAVFVFALYVQTFAVQAARVVGPWSQIYEGIDYATGSDTSPRLMKVFAIRVDLWNPLVVLYASHGNGSDPSEVTVETGPQFLADHGCKVAVNASYCSLTSPYADIWGLGISDGTVVSSGAQGSYGPQYNVQLNFTADNIANMLTSYATPTGIWTAISGNAYHLVNGVALGATETIDPRTSAGISRDGRYLILLCVDGRQTGWSEGATILEMSRWQLDFGAWNAMNLDGGGSTCMVREDVGVVNKPSGGSIRPVGVHLGVKLATPTNPPYLFDSGIDSWFPGESVSSINWAPAPTWPGCIYFDQTDDYASIISPPTSFVGNGSEVVSVRVYPQNGSTASHNMQLYWKTNAESYWDEAKSTPVVSYTAQNGWTIVNFNMNNAKWTGQTINRLRLYFDDTNHANRWIIDSIGRAPSSPPSAPSAVTATPATVHPGESSKLSAVAGAGEIVEWFVGSIGGTQVPGGESPTVSPTVNTTYYARAKNTISGYVSGGVPVTVNVRAYGMRISALSHTPIPTNPVKVWGKVTNASPLKISDGSGEITVTGLTASVGDYLAVTGNWNGTVLAASGPATVFAEPL